MRNKESHCYQTVKSFDVRPSYFSDYENKKVQQN